MLILLFCSNTIISALPRMTTLHVVLISIFTTGIIATPYCDQQFKQLQAAAGNLKQKCTINATTITTCCDLNAFYFFNKPSGVYQMDCWCGGKWNIANVFCAGGVGHDVTIIA